jgi:23S rRNA pseudouridine1911/1915/1917 synthase
MPTNNHTVPTGEGEKRVDLFLVQAEPDYSRGYFQKLIGDGRILINGTPARKAGQIVKGGESIVVEHPDVNRQPVGQDIPLEILYEDDQVMAINKPVGIVVHPLQADEEEGTIVHALLFHNKAIASAVHDPESDISQLRPGIVHRLDRDTSGVLLVAKTAEALENLSAQFKEHTVEKSYLALVSGAAKEETVSTGMERKVYKRAMMGVSKKEGEGRQAITHFKPIKGYDFFGKTITLVQCIIDTGRTHQIRVHCKYSGHPVLGDQLYTNRTATDLARRLGIKRQLLHAASLSFDHPSTGKRMKVEAPTPTDFADALLRLK